MNGENCNQLLFKTVIITMKALGIIIFALCLSFVLCKLIIQPDEKYVDCTKNGTSKYIKWTDLYQEAVNDTLFYLNGEIFV